MSHEIILNEIKSCICRKNSGSSHSHLEVASVNPDGPGYHVLCNAKDCNWYLRLPHWPTEEQALDSWNRIISLIESEKEEAEKSWKKDKE